MDTGICHAARGLLPSREIVQVDPGRFFEQWVVAEIWKRSRYRSDVNVYYFSTKDGSEIDLIVESDRGLIPVEIKWTDKPSRKDARHLLKFIQESDRAHEGFVVCRCPRPQRIADQITAIPWQCL
jgi:predicted AAA+ superfamily ATPase